MRPCWTGLRNVSTYLNAAPEWERREGKRALETSPRAVPVLLHKPCLSCLEEDGLWQPHVEAQT